MLFGDQIDSVDLGSSDIFIKKTYNNITSAANGLSLPTAADNEYYLSFDEERYHVAYSDGTINLDLCDKENDTGNVYSQTVTGESAGDFEMYMKVENIRLYQGNYNVKVSDKLITEWQHQSIDLKYYIALEP